jgi:SOUL heme-binding protein
MLNAFNTQFRQNLQTFAGDVMNPSRIPQRISQQTEDIVKEVQNIFAETPIGLKGPKYTVLYTTDSYEVRHYESYNVATTTMMGDSSSTTTTTSSSGSSTSTSASSTISDSKSVDIWSITEQGAAFNTLASYIFGANQEQLVMEMTTPVTTTMTGEMRFYVDMKVPPEPIQVSQQLTSTSFSTQNDVQQIPQFIEQARSQKNTIYIETIPESILAVRKFTGFVTNGEVQRQKNILLSSIKLDENYIQLDIPHGSTVKHIIFQYNPPYTLPFVRRNEIAIPVTIIQ